MFRIRPFSVQDVFNFVRKGGWLSASYLDNGVRNLQNARCPSIFVNPYLSFPRKKSFDALGSMREYPASAYKERLLPRRQHQHSLDVRLYVVCAKLASINTYFKVRTNQGYARAK